MYPGYNIPIKLFRSTFKFTPATRRKIIEAAGVSRAKSKTLIAEVENAIGYLGPNYALQKSLPSVQELTKNLHSLREQITDLKDKLEEISSVQTPNVLPAVLYCALQNAASIHAQMEQNPRSGYTLGGDESQGNPPAVITLESSINNMTRLIQLIDTFCKYGISKCPGPRKGRKEDQALHELAARLVYIWVDLLGLREESPTFGSKPIQLSKFGKFLETLSTPDNQLPHKVTGWKGHVDRCLRERRQQRKSNAIVADQRRDGEANKIKDVIEIQENPVNFDNTKRISPKR